MTLEIKVREVIHVLDVFMPMPVRRVIRAAISFFRNSNERISQFLAANHLISRGPPAILSMVKTYRGSRIARGLFFIGKEVRRLYG